MTMSKGLALVAEHAQTMVRVRPFLWSAPLGFSFIFIVSGPSVPAISVVRSGSLPRIASGLAEVAGQGGRNARGPRGGDARRTGRGTGCEDAGRAEPASDCSFRPTPTVRSAGTRTCIHLDPKQGLRFRTDLNQTGSQIGMRNAALSWTLMWDLMTAAGWKPRQPVSSPPMPGCFAEWGEVLGRHPELNPAFTDRMMGWRPGRNDPLRPVTEWSRWLRRGRGDLWEGS